MLIILKILILLWSANLVPVLLAYIFEEKWNTPLDGGAVFPDGKPVLGSNKTIRGTMGGILTGGAVGWIMGIPIQVALAAGFMSMLGDITNSFLKRRLGMAQGTDLPVMDQALEGVFPCIALGILYSFSFGRLFLLLLIFVPTTYIGARFVNQVLLSEPFAGYSRKLRSKIRFREWRACQTIDYPFHPIINLERTMYYHWFMKTVFKLMGLYEKGMRNALDVKLRSYVFGFDDLPMAFDNYSILFLSDLHLDCMEGLAQKAQTLVVNLNPDLCILGGDYRTESWGSFSKALFHVKNLVENIKTRHGIYAVLGNHDCLEMVSPLKEKGVNFLVNDAVAIEQNGDRIWIAGVDDPYFYEGHDLPETFDLIPADAFTIFIAHTPGIYQEAATYSPQLYLCGHTHAGQVQLPYIGPVITHCNAPQQMVYGTWEYKGMKGYTSSGVGTSGIPVRFGCHGEIVTITLKNTRYG